MESWQNQRRLFEGVAPIFIGEPEPVEEVSLILDGFEPVSNQLSLFVEVYQ